MELLLKSAPSYTNVYKIYLTKKGDGFVTLLIILSSTGLRVAEIKLCIESGDTALVYGQLSFDTASLQVMQICD